MPKITSRSSWKLSIGAIVSAFAMVIPAAYGAEEAQPFAALLLFSKNVEQTKEIFRQSGMAGVPGLYRGEIMHAIVGGHICKIGVDGNCRVTGRVWGETPTGAVWFDYKDLDIWSKPPPKRIKAEYDEWYFYDSTLAMSLESHEPVGNYTIHVELSDLNSGLVAVSSMVMQTAEPVKAPLD